jgi:hypothetical protein
LPSAIEQVHRDWRDRGLAVLAVNIQEPRDTVAAWVRGSKITTTVLLDAGAVTRAYKVTVTPTAFLIDRDGRLVAKAIGSKPWTGATARGLLAALVGR